jgi:cytoskeleton protein RodZ
MNQHTQGSFEGECQAYRPKPDGGTDPAGEAGWFLQRERERRKVALRDVAQAIRVHPVHLDAIERGDLTRLPNRADAIGMVGAYAEFLNFDPQPMMMHYAQLLPRNTASQPAAKAAARPLGSAHIIEFPLARRLKEIAGGAGGVVASICAAMVLFGGVSYSLLPGSDTEQPVEVAVSEPVDAGETGPATEVPADVTRTDEPMTGEVATTVAAPDSTDDPIGALLSAQADNPESGLSGIEELIANDGEVDQVSDNITTATTEVVERVNKPAQRDERGRVFGADNEDARLVLRATAPVWVRIEDGKGKAILTETLMAGDSFRVPNQQGLVVIARDGGLLEYEIDGEAAGRLGSPGEILVNRTLDISELMNRGG